MVNLTLLMFQKNIYELSQLIRQHYSFISHMLHVQLFMSLINS